MDTRTYSASDDLSRVWGRHQLAVGANVAYSTYDGTDYAGSNGNFTFYGAATGLALADFLTGQMSAFGAQSPVITRNNNWYIGVYGSGHLAGDRSGDPQSGRSLGAVPGERLSKDGTISNFSLDNFRNGREEHPVS